MKKPPKRELRRRAEDVLTSERGTADDPASSLLHELEVHQVELELQNEELRLSRQNAEEALQRYTEVFDFAPVGYSTLDSGGTIREMNHAAAQLLGAERSRFIGKRFLAYVAGPSQPAFQTLVSTAMGCTTSVSCELELRRDSTTTPVRATAAVIRHTEPVLLLAFEDISERRRKEAELARTESALRELNRRKDEFLGVLSHELRNPLSPIRTSVAVLQLSPPGSDAAASAISIIDRAAAHLTRLIDDLLDITRITRGKVQLKREPVELCGLIRGTVDDQRASFTQRRIALHLGCPEEPAWTYGDPARLVQLFTNVLTNAEKFTPAGGEVTITLERTEHLAVVKVTDTGVGIAPEVIGSLFEPFAQAPQALDRSRGGLGLGLSMVKSLAELHGGRVSIRSAGLGKGTEVLITLPAEQEAPQPTAPHPPSLSLVQRRVVVVEDQPDTAHSLQQALRLKGHEVRVAYDGTSAIELVGSFKPDVVLCDLGLPDMDGYEVAMRVRADAALRGTFLVALSGYARPEDLERARSAGFDRHLAKPPELRELDALLAALTGRRNEEPWPTNMLR